MSDHTFSENQIYFLEDQRIDVDFEASGLILDIGGGGEGIIGLLKGNQVIAIDISKRELREAPPGPAKVVMDARKLKFLSDTFDAVTAFFSLMYIQPQTDCEQVFREAFRVLKPEGRFLIWDAVIPRRLHPEKEIVALRLTVNTPQRTISTGYGTRWPSEKRNLAFYAQLAQNVGFEIVNKETQKGLFSLTLGKP